ncbi:polysaccharide deacetylase family protein [Anaerostipes faecalis]|uniref:polysaccharide deacetylase family protein n=1 Tax=Anaerostipes faecalis TaxID=2738446 RepID=UPI001C1E8658|nr:polysaccharide deacetylase family protein [Anaerostipes faecalis]
MPGTLIVSLDFELFWGMQDCTSLSDYRANVLGGREAIPKLLEMFKHYQIHATWATVGFMFAENFDELRQYFPEKGKFPTYTNKKLLSYRCFSKIGENEQTAPCFYAPSLIKEIACTDGQEIASHTFSHYYCREKGQTLEQFEEDIKAAVALASDKGYSLSSIVLPRNQCSDEYIAVLNKFGINAYRDEENDWIHEKIRFRPLLRLLRLADVYFPLTGQGGYHPNIENGIVNLVGSRMYKPIMKPLKFLEPLKMMRIKKQMLHAAKNGLTFHLWWHPHNIGIMTEDHLKQLEEIFQYYRYLNKKYGMKSLNMREVARKQIG